MQTEFVNLVTIGYQKYDVPNGVMKLLRDEINEMKGNNFKDCQPYNYRLVGNIKKEFRIIKSAYHLNNYISDVCPEYWKNTHRKYFSKKKHKIIIDKDIQEHDVWVNFQERGEFNPFHNHAGVLSFVIYVSLPYFLEDEIKHIEYIPVNDPNRSTALPGMLGFYYPDKDAHGGIGSVYLKTDRSFENKMIVFDSTLNHTVHPFFTSDEYRITVSGNIEFDE